MTLDGGCKRQFWRVVTGRVSTSIRGSFARGDICSIKVRSGHFVAVGIAEGCAVCRADNNRLVVRPPTGSGHLFH